MPIKEAENFLDKRLQVRRAAGSLRKLQLHSDRADFSSNDYLGVVQQHLLSKHKLLDSENSASGATGSRLISGNSKLAEDLEFTIAKFHQAEQALIFNSGYDANLGLCSSIAQRGDFIFYDELTHASIRDGVRLSHAKSFSFKHNNLKNLSDKMSRLSGRIFIIVEAVYSMDGDKAPLVELVELAQKFAAHLIVDEAHSIGAIGAGGEGLVQSLGLHDYVLARVYTYGKAFGCHGASVVGSGLLKEFLINYARSFIYTTALPPEALQKIAAAYQIIPTLAEERLALKQRLDFFDAQAIEFNLPLVAAGTAIKSILVPGNLVVKELANNIQVAGFDVRPIMSPTVAAGSERLRICLHGFNTMSDIKELLKLLKNSLVNSR